MLKAILLAAGQGTRLKPHTDHQPKCLVTLAGHALLDYQLTVLRQAGIQDIVLVTGYCRDKLTPYGLPQILNHAYDTTNMVYSLMCAADVLDGLEDVIVSYTDIVYEPRVLAALIHDAEEFSTVVDLEWLSLWSQRFADPLTDAETLKLDKKGHVLEIGKKPTCIDDIEGQYIGLTKLSRRVVLRIKDIYAGMDRNVLYSGKHFNSLYMTDFLQHCIDGTELDLHAVPIQRGWLEVDTTNDLETYSQMIRTHTLPSFCNLAGIAQDMLTEITT